MDVLQQPINYSFAEASHARHAVVSVAPTYTQLSQSQTNKGRRTHLWVVRGGHANTDHPLRCVRTKCAQNAHPEASRVEQFPLGAEAGSAVGKYNAFGLGHCSCGSRKVRKGLRYAPHSRGSASGGTSRSGDSRGHVLEREKALEETGGGERTKTQAKTGIWSGWWECRKLKIQSPHTQTTHKPRRQHQRANKHKNDNEDTDTDKADTKKRGETRREEKRKEKKRRQREKKRTKARPR